MTPTARCFFSDIGGCDGGLQRAHLIPKQRIRREFKGELSPGELHELVWHPAVWRWMCQYHHANFDHGALRIDRSAVPTETEDYAEVFDLGWSLDASYGKL